MARVTADAVAEARADCPLCPRLVAFRGRNQTAEPGWYNGAVPSFGEAAARLLIVGLAPGLRGANRTGRPFTGDYAGDLLYATLLKLGLAEGEYRADPDDGLRLKGVIILNAVKCLPPQNKTLPAEETNFEKLMAGPDDISAPDTKVLEAKIEETSVASTEEPDEAEEPAPAKLPFEVKKEVKAPVEKKVVASVESSWNIQIGAYPKKEEARLKLKEIRASGYKFLSGKQAITVEVQKGAKTVYRARFSGFTQKTAKAACAQLSKKGLTCLAFSPQS